MTIDDVQAMAFNVLSLPTPTATKRKVNPDAAIYKFWLANKEMGAPATSEIPLDDGTTAVILGTGKVLHWTGGDTVEVI